MDEDQAYRAMDLLVSADTQGEVQEQVFFSVADLLNLEVDLLFFDTTSTYFELDDEDQGGEGFRVLGHSKDHRPDLPQVVIGLAVTKEGIPVRVWCFPGDTSDQTILKGVRDDLRHWRLGRVITVVDRGFSSDDNLAYLTRGGGHYICGEKIRDGSPDAKEALRRPGRYRVVRDNLEVKEVRLGAEKSRRFIVCHNPGEAEKDRTEREDKLARIEAEITRIAAAASGTAHRRSGRPTRPTPTPSARSETTSPWAATSASSPRVASSWTSRRSATKRASTASTCCPPRTPS